MRQPQYEVLEYRNHYRIIRSRVYRDAIVRLSDGQVRLYALPEARLGEL